MPRPRLKYKSGRVEDAAVPWAERYSRITLMMDAFVVRLLQARRSNISRVANLIKLDWHTVNDVIARGVARRTQEPLRNVRLASDGSPSTTGSSPNLGAESRDHSHDQQ